MEGLLEVVVAEELLRKDEIDRDEFQDYFQNRTVMRFNTLENATKFARGFALDYLIPKYGVEEVRKFPMTKTEPARLTRSLDEGAQMIGEFIGLLPREKPPEEIWLVINDDRYREVQDYLNSLLN